MAEEIPINPTDPSVAEVLADFDATILNVEAKIQDLRAASSTGGDTTSQVDAVEAAFRDFKAKVHARIQQLKAALDG